MERRNGRNVVWPIRLLWLPTVLVGVWMLAQIDISVARVGDNWSYDVAFPAPTTWTANMGLLIAGSILTGIGLVLLGIYLWAPTLNWRALEMEFPLLTWGASLLMLAGFVTFLQPFGHEATVEGQSFVWSFFLRVRPSWFDRTLGAMLGGLAVLVWFASHGSWRVVDNED